MAIGRVNHAPREPVHGMPFREGAGREQMIGPQVRYIEDVRGAFRQRKKDTGNTGKNGLGFDEHDVGPGYSQAEQQSAAHERDLAQQLATDPRADRSFEPGLNHPDSFQIGHHHGLAAIVAMDETLRIMGQAGEDGDLVAAPVQFLGQTRKTHRRCAGFRREVVRDDQDVHAPRGIWPGQRAVRYLITSAWRPVGTRAVHLQHGLLVGCSSTVSRRGALGRNPELNSSPERAQTAAAP